LGLELLRRSERYCPFLVKPSMLKDNIDSHNADEWEPAADCPDAEEVEQGPGAGERLAEELGV